MPRIKLQFTEDQIKVIRCLRFTKLRVKHERKDIVGKVKEIGALLDGVDPGEDANGSVENETSHELCEMIRSELNDIYKSALRSQEIANDDADKYYGFDMYELFNGTHPYDVVALILGQQDKRVIGGEERYGRPKYPDELEREFDEILDYIYERIIDIEDLIHQRCNLGGIQADVKYVAFDHERIWRTEEELKEYTKKNKRRKNKENDTEDYSTI